MKNKIPKKIVEQLNKQQKEGKFHIYTCDRNHSECQVDLNDGVLIATENCWICPCGNYKEDWYFYE